VNYRKSFRVESGEKMRLDDIDPSFTGTHESEAEAKAAIADDVERLRKLQYRLYAEHERALLIVLQALDAGGKDGTVRHVFGAFNPQGANVHAFKVPTPEEAAHDFLWRVHAATPARGHIAIFNRSHYEDVLVARVHDFVPKDVWAERYDRINEFEKNLADAGTHILKFFLHISPDEQLRRFKKRLDDPQSWWKLNESDYEERKHWDDYRKAYEDVLERCSTKHAPWYVIPANHKWFRNLAVARIVADTLDELDLELPKPAADIEAIRRLYAAAANAPTDGASSRTG
jgi:PPK2 family polyphosphate:nucleotide phosphotransferase